MYRPRLVCIVCVVPFTTLVTRGTAAVAAPDAYTERKTVCEYPAQTTLK